MIKVKGFIWKIGKADKGDKRSNGDIERIAAQLQILRDHLTKKFKDLKSSHIESEVVLDLGQQTTKYAKEIEEKLQEFFHSPEFTTNRDKIKAGNINLKLYAEYKF